MPLTHSFEERILILTPTGKDSELLKQVLDERSMKNEICSTLIEVSQKAALGVGAIIIAEEALTIDQLPVLNAMLGSQPSWSDVPIIILTSSENSDRTKIKILNAFAAGGNLTLLGRPLRAINLLSMLQVALRSRRRQYEVRELLAAQKKDHDALKAATESLAKSNRDLEHFASIASHDLQEPLRKIRSFAGRLKVTEDQMGETERDYFHRIENAAERMSQLIESLLDYSRISSDQTFFDEVDLSQVMSEVISDLEVIIEESRADIRIQPLPVVTANRFQMRQLFQNMIGNAIKYRNKNVPPLIRISHEIKDDKFLLRFKDNGIGFDEKYLDRIFKPFQRLHGKNEYQGTGMGLAICEKIARTHEGHLSATSVVGEGSTFLVTLPASIVQSVSFHKSPSAVFNQNI